MVVLFMINQSLISTLRNKALLKVIKTTLKTKKLKNKTQKTLTRKKLNL